MANISSLKDFDIDESRLMFLTIKLGEYREEVNSLCFLEIY